MGLLSLEKYPAFVAFKIFISDLNMIYQYQKQLQKMAPREHPWAPASPFKAHLHMTMLPFALYLNVNSTIIS